ncbi:GNAT family N-acetyltransferase [Vibrio palustris]|uniref:N-acetyltransferase domain-containing protein n=1 Tax=Vibrio palustris TaxID=1918946 RepID=A0A1R4B4P2_9VIBR|nr:GNAT family N-acetyltransferase [Vibrio palustris]SJL83892.1 hypothetical protein VPAL9027_01871 [Vibrio palustris]
MEFISNRLIMSKISLIHQSLFHTLHTDPTVISLCFDEPTLAEINAKFESRLKPWDPTSSDWLCLVVTHQCTGEYVGITGFCLKDNIAEVGFMFLPQYQGFGYATESLMALLEYSKQHLGINHYSAVVTEGNVNSERVLVKSGFTLTQIVPDAYEIGGKQYCDHIYHLNNTISL